MHNPYQTPSAELQTAVGGDPRRLGDPVRLNAGRGIDWFTEGWQLFMRAPGVLLGIAVLLVVLYALASVVPLLGSLAILLLWPVFTAGYFLALRHADEGQPVAFADLFAPFSDGKGLLGLGWLYLLGVVAVVMVAGVALFGFGALAAVAGQGIGAAGGWERVGTGLVVVTLLVLALLTVLGMGFIFAPILVHQQQIPAVEAIRLSFVACLRNWLPFLRADPGRRRPRSAGRPSAGGPAGPAGLRRAAAAADGRVPVLRLSRHLLALSRSGQRGRHSAAVALRPAMCRR